MSVAAQKLVLLSTVFSGVVVEQHAEEPRRSNLLALGQEVCIASLWAVFYVATAGAVIIHYLFHV